MKRIHLSKRAKIIAGAVTAAILLLIALSAYGAGGNTNSGNTAAGSGSIGIAQQYFCYGTDSYGTPEVQADSVKSLANCELFLGRLAEITYAGTVPGGVATQGIACIAVNANADPWEVTVTDNGPSNLCELLAQDGYGETQ